MSINNEFYRNNVHPKFGVFLRLKANLQISPCLLPLSSCGNGSDRPLTCHIIGWSEWVVILMVKDFIHLPMQPFVGIAGLILMRAIRDCIPLRGSVPYNSIGTIIQNYSLSPIEAADPLTHCTRFPVLSSFSSLTPRPLGQQSGG